MQSRMSVRTIPFAAALLLFCASSAVQADIIVTSDAGTVGSFQLTNNGGGSMTLNVDGTELLTSINGTAVGPFTANFDASIAMTVTPFGSHEYVVGTSNTLTKTFFDGAGGMASFHYDILAAQTGTLLKDDALLGGQILGLVSNTFHGYDFSGINGAQNFALTATNYAGGASTLDGVFTTTGGIARGSLAFSESAVGGTHFFTTPLPGTLVMAVTSLVSVIVLRVFKRSKTISA